MDSVLRGLLSSKIQNDEHGIIGSWFPISNKEWDGRLCKYYGGVDDTISVDDLLDDELDTYELIEYDDCLMREMINDNLTEFIEFESV